MRLAIVYLSGGGLSGGARSTLGALVGQLRADSRVERLDLFVPPRAMGLGEVQSLSARTWPPRDMLRGWAGLRTQIRELEPDVVFIPNAAWFDTGGIPTVCMVRNMEALVAPFGDNPFSVGCKNLLRTAAARRACRRAGRVIAVSRYVRDFLVNRWRLPQRKIGVVYHGVQPAMPEEKMQPPAALGEDKPGAFWFTAGSLIPYRGLEDIIRALAGRSRSGGDENLLVAGAGVYSDAYRRRMQALVRELGLAGRVRWLGRVGGAEMAWCFAHSLAFVMTSRLEACPNLVLEAMSHGCVSIATTCPPMPELFGESAFYYASGRPDELGELLERVAQMPGRDRADFTRAATARAGLFSWPIAADNTIKQLQAAIEGR